MKNIFLFVFSLISLGCSAQGLTIDLKNGEDAEKQGREQLERISKTYGSGIGSWLFTKKVIIDKNAIPFSHPVLTLNCRYLNDDLKQLSTFLHEQFHWLEESRDVQKEKAIAEFKAMFTSVPVKGREGARDEYSTYLHLIVCDLEFQAMTKVVGEQKAKQIMSEWTHYTWIYDKVLNDQRIRRVNVANGFVVP